MKTKLWVLAVTVLVSFLIYLVYPLYIPPSPPENGTSLVIHKALNRLYYYEDGRLQQTYDVATGQDPAMTPEGTFRIVAREADPEGLGTEAILGTRWLGLNVPGDEDGLRYGIHGTNDPSSIGHHASKGCIRMHNQDIEELYPNIPLQTNVLIIRGAPLHRLLINIFQDQ